MSNSTVRLYDLLKSEYPGQVYLGQISQSVNLQTADGVILLESISSSASKNKDNGKRDQIVYYVHVIGSILKTVDTLSEEIRNLVEPYTDEYIYLVEYDNTGTDYNEDAETWEKVLVFNVLPNTDGLNTPTGYWEYYGYFNFLTGSITILNQNALNFMAITWDYTNTNNEFWSFEATHNITPTPTSNIEVFWLAPNAQTMQMQWTSTIGITNLLLELGSTEVYQETQILIRVRKDVSGSFVSTN